MLPGSRGTAAWASLALTFSTALAPAAVAQTKHLDAGVRHAILSEHFHAVFRVSEIPRAVIAAASEARGPKLAQFPFELADPGEPFQSTDVIVTRGLPGRRLVAAFASDGIAHTYHVAAFAVRGKHARFVWHAWVQRKLTGIDDLRKLLRDSDAATIDDTYTQFY